jgi:AbrB family looped-hinge helix DNA binding protein
MAVAQSRVTAQGQVSVPAEVRRKLAIGPGSVLEWEEDGNRMIVRRAGKFSSKDIHAAVFKRPPKAKSLMEMKAAVSRYIKTKHARG